MKKVQLAIMNTQLDEAKAQALRDPQAGVAMVVAALNGAKTDSETQHIMAGATDRGFFCQYWPVQGGMGIRVEYTPEVKK